jgi:hypothetical protein
MRFTNVNQNTPFSGPYDTSSLTLRCESSQVLISYLEGSETRDMTLLGFQDSITLDFFARFLTLAHATMSADVSSFRKAKTSRGRHSGVVDLD